MVGHDLIMPFLFYKLTKRFSIQQAWLESIPQMSTIIRNKCKVQINLVAMLTHKIQYTIYGQTGTWYNAGVRYDDWIHSQSGHWLS